MFSKQAVCPANFLKLAHAGDVVTLTDVVQSLAGWSVCRRDIEAGLPNEISCCCCSAPNFIGWKSLLMASNNLGHIPFVLTSTSTTKHLSLLFTVL